MFVEIVEKSNGDTEFGYWCIISSSLGGLKFREIGLFNVATLKFFTYVLENLGIGLG